jgi:hypothetical protein
MLRKAKVPAERARELSHGINFDWYPLVLLWAIGSQTEFCRDIVWPLATLLQAAERPTTPRVVEMK